MFCLKNISTHFFRYFGKFKRKSNVEVLIFEGLRVSFMYSQEMIMAEKVQIRTFAWTKCSQLNSKKSRKIYTRFDKKRNFANKILRPYSALCKFFPLDGFVNILFSGGIFKLYTFFASPLRKWEKKVLFNVGK